MAPTRRAMAVASPIPRGPRRAKLRRNSIRNGSTSAASGAVPSAFSASRQGSSNAREAWASAPLRDARLDRPGPLHPTPFAVAVAPVQRAGVGSPRPAPQRSPASPFIGCCTERPGGRLYPKQAFATGGGHGRMEIAPLSPIRDRELQGPSRHASRSRSPLRGRTVAKVAMFNLHQRCRGHKRCLMSV